MKLFFSFFKQSIKHNKILFALIYSFVFVLCGFKILIPVFYRIIIDSIPKGTEYSLAILLALYALALLLLNIVTTLWYILLDIAGVQFLTRIRGDLFDKLIVAPLDTINSFSREKIKNIIFTDVIQMFSSLTINSVQITSNIIVLLVGFVIAFVIHKMLSVVFLVFVVVGFAISFLSRRIVKKQSQKVNAQLKQQNLFTNSFVDEIEIFKTHDLSNYHTNKHKTLMKNFQNTILKSDGIQVFLKSFLQGLRSFFTLAVVCFLLLSKQGATIGDILFLSLISELILSISSDTELLISQSYSLLPSFENVESILKMTQENFGKETYDKLQSLLLDKVSFAYRDTLGTENNALKSINFSFHCGDRVRIVGKNGSGKSTLAKLLSCLIKPTHGTIKINGVPMQSYDRTFLKQKIVYVNQDEPFLNESILDYFNALGIAFSKDSLKEKLDLWNFHQDLTESSTENQLTDNAKKLSGGMRKKLLAIKLFEKIKEADIVIVDEISSGLDYNSILLFESLREKALSENPNCIYFEISHTPTDDAFFTHTIELKG